MDDVNTTMTKDARSDDRYEEPKKRKTWPRTLIIVIIAIIVIVFLTLQITVWLVPEFDSIPQLIEYIKSQL